jgi:hypothetical protein
MKPRTANALHAALDMGLLVAVIWFVIQVGMSGVSCHPF